MSDVAASQARPRVPPNAFKSPPLVVLNNFAPKHKHLALAASLFQGMFPSINVHTVNLATCQVRGWRVGRAGGGGRSTARGAAMCCARARQAVCGAAVDSWTHLAILARQPHTPPPQNPALLAAQRVVLLSCDPAASTISLRHYSISMAPSGVKKPLKALVMRQDVPDMGALADVSELITKSGYGSVRCVCVCVCGRGGEGGCTRFAARGSGGSVMRRPRAPCSNPGSPTRTARTTTRRKRCRTAGV
jgi:hypothetical protein